MPPITPTGGLSIIIHIMVNIFTFFSRIIAKLFRFKIKKSIAHHLVSERGNTVLRRFSAYLTVVIIFVAIITTGYFVVRTGVNIHKTGQNIFLQ
jgi:hypothetical protein